MDTAGSRSTTTSSTDIERIKSLIADGDKNDVSSNFADSVIILGNTGSGKTTLFKYLSGIQMTAFKNTSGIAKKLVIDVTNSHLDNQGKINHTSLSGTTVPNYYLLRQTLLADCPGFSDNRGVGQDIANAYHIKRILKVSSLVKIMIVMELDMFEGKALKFFDLLNLLSEMFEDVNQIQPGLMIVITKVGCDVTLIDIREHINSIRADHMSSLPSKQKQWLDLLVNSSEKIAIFRQPSISGTINDVDRHCLLQKLTTLQAINPASIKISVSDRSKVYVARLMTGACESIIDLNGLLCTAICDTIKTSKNLLCANLYTYLLTLYKNSVYTNADDIEVTSELCGQVYLICLKTYISETISINILDTMIQILEKVRNLVASRYQQVDIKQLGLYLDKPVAEKLVNSICKALDHFTFFSDLNPNKNMNPETLCLHELNQCANTIERHINEPLGKMIDKITEDTIWELSEFFSKLENKCMELTKKLPMSDELSAFFQLGQNLQFMKDNLCYIVPNVSGASASNRGFIFNLAHHEIDYKNLTLKLQINFMIMQKYANQDIIAAYIDRVASHFDSLTQGLMTNLIKRQTATCTLL